MIQRVGREAVLEEAVRDTLSSWYSDAIESAGIVPVGDPKVDLGELPPQGQALELLDRDRRAAEGASWGPTWASRSPAASRRSRRSSSTPRSRRCASAWRACRPRSDPPRRAISWSSTTSGGSTRRATSARASPSPGGEGRDQLLELGSGT